MLALTGILVLTVCQSILADDAPPNIPEKCRAPPQDVVNPHECCKIPPFFSEEDLKSCGFEKPQEGRRFQPGPPDCSKQNCIVKKHNLANADGSMNKDAVKAYFDKWATTNAAFKDAVEIAKERCVSVDLPGPICEADKIIFCSSSTLFAECPVWENNDNCKRLKDHMNECRPPSP